MVSILAALQIKVKAQKSTVKHCFPCLICSNISLTRTDSPDEMGISSAITDEVCDNMQNSLKLNFSS